VLLHIAVGLLVALGASWVLLLVALAALRPRGMPFRELVQIAPDSVRLMRTLSRDPDTPRSVRWRLRIAVLYNVQPFNLIPDFIPVVGFADNVAVIL
jgi:uncharacterized membrane protein YkvA (DUF1232 family)